MKATELIALTTLAALLLTGCQTSSPSQYISPRVTGRVLDAQTQQPIKGVQVRRVTPDQDPNVDQAIKGGQNIEQAPAIRTGNDGSFVLDSERALAFFQKLGWYSVTLSFEHAGYERRKMDYTLTDATQSPNGEPLVQAGDIRLQPKPN